MEWYRWHLRKVLNVVSNLCPRNWQYHPNQLLRMCHTLGGSWLHSPKIHSSSHHDGTWMRSFSYYRAFQSWYLLIQQPCPLTIGPYPRHIEYQHDLQSNQLHNPFDLGSMTLHVFAIWEVMLLATMDTRQICTSFPNKPIQPTLKIVVGLLRSKMHTLFSAHPTTISWPTVSMV